MAYSSSSLSKVELSSSLDSFLAFKAIDLLCIIFYQHTLSHSSAEAEYCGVAHVVRVLHVPSRYQYVDIFTNGLPSALFEEFHSSLSFHPPPAPTARAY
ncbi:hypothetical protein Tco_1136605 [Tanacetum coccineum]